MSLVELNYTLWGDSHGKKCLWCGREQDGTIYIHQSCVSRAEDKGIRLSQIVRAGDRFVAEGYKTVFETELAASNPSCECGSFKSMSALQGSPLHSSWCPWRSK